MAVNPSPNQIRAARALLGWRQKRLADETGLAEVTIRHIERRWNNASRKSLIAILGAFDRAGIEFIEGGVRTKGL